MFKSSLKRLFSSALILSALTASTSTLATVVVFNTSHGDIEVNLFDQSTPTTVTNFLTYLNDGDYDNTVIHRSINGFISQGGGFRFEGTTPLTAVPARDAIANEPKWSNRRGTIAMAKLGGNANSATNQWFFNLADNSANLDLQNGGFTVFGQITDQGMEVVDTIANLPVCNEIPMPDYDCATAGTPGVENFVTVYNITIVDSSENTADSLSPIKNTLINVVPEQPSSGGGSFTWLGLFILGVSAFARKR